MLAVRRLSAVRDDNPQREVATLGWLQTSIADDLRHCVGASASACNDLEDIKTVGTVDAASMVDPFDYFSSEEDEAN